MIDCMSFVRDIVDAPEPIPGRPYNPVVDIKRLIERLDNEIANVYEV